MVQEQPTLTAKRRPPLLELSNQATADLLVRIVSPIVPLQVPDELRDTLRLSNSIREQQNTLIAQKSALPRAPDTQNAASDAVPAPDVVPAPDLAKSTNSNEESEQPTKQTAVGSDTRASSHGPEPDSVAISAVEPGPHDVSGPNSVSESTRSPHLAPHSHSASRSVSPDKGRASPQRIPKVPSPLRGPAVSPCNFCNQARGAGRTFCSQDTADLSNFCSHYTPFIRCCNGQSALQRQPGFKCKPRLQSGLQ